MIETGLTFISGALHENSIKRPSELLLWFTHIVHVDLHQVGVNTAAISVKTPSEVLAYAHGNTDMLSTQLRPF